MNFQPSPDDLDYPGKLERVQQEADAELSEAPDEPQEERPLVADNGEPSSSGDGMVRARPALTTCSWSCH